MINHNLLNHPVARVSGVTKNDTKFEAAEKAIKTMREFGLPAASIRKAEKMLERARQREI